MQSSQGRFGLSYIKLPLYFNSDALSAAMKVFYFVNRWPKNKDCSRAQKVFSVLESLINVGHNVVLLSPDSSQIDSDSDLQKMPVETIFINPNKVASSIASASHKPDLAIFNSHHTEQLASIYLYSKFNKCPRILQINQLSGLQLWRKRNYTLLGTPFLHDYDTAAGPSLQASMEEKFEPKELQSIRRSDFYFCGNDFICHYLKKHLKLNNFIINSLGLPINEFQREIVELQFREFRHRKHFAFIGNMLFDKNIQMIESLITHIWPTIRAELSGAELHVYGSGFNKNLQNRKKELEKKGIFIKGLLQDSDELQRYKALLYPVQYTTGTKGAMVQSWFQHTPVVTTPVGAEGLFLETSEPQFSADGRGQVSEGFFKQRIFNKQEQLQKSQLQKYYQQNKFSQSLNELSFGGLCTSWSYLQFAKNAIALHNNESLWREALVRSRKAVLKHHSEGQMEVNLKYGISQVELAVHEGRKTKDYKQEWDKYIKSKEGHTKLQEKRTK